MKIDLGPVRVSAAARQNVIHLGKRRREAAAVNGWLIDHIVEGAASVAGFNKVSAVALRRDDKSKMPRNARRRPPSKSKQRRAMPTVQPFSAGGYRFNAAASALARQACGLRSSDCRVT